jgi:uncharacterized membrane protein YkoI
MSLISSARKGTAAIAALGALVLGGSAIAGAATTSSTASGTAASGTTDKPANNETALTGATLKSASDAAIAANPGATVDRASTEDPADANGAAYEVKITKADGTRAEVLEDSSFKVLSTKADSGHGGRGHGGGNPNEKALTGADLTKATAAAKTAVPGGTVERASTEDPAENSGAAYEVHVTKTDGSRVTVLLNSAFAVTKTVADNGPGGHGR